MKNIAVIGGGSAIAKAYLAANGNAAARVGICARNQGELDVLVADLAARHPNAQWRGWACDIQDLALSPVVWTEMAAYLGRIDEVVVAPGILGDQTEMERQPMLAYELLQLNSSAVSFWILMIAQTLRAQKTGKIGVITSVAGVRGRASNYIYGSSKAQLIALLGGLRCALHSSGVQVLDFRPGMVATPMTAHLRQGLLMASAAKVGGDLRWAMERREGVVYSPKFWSAIMLAIQAIPYALFKKMKF